MGFMKLKKNRRFDYKPIYYKGEGNPYELKHKFDDYRSTVNPTKGLKGKFNQAINEYNRNKSDASTKRVFIIAGILILIFLFIIEFDLTIFLPQN